MKPSQEGLDEMNRLLGRGKQATPDGACPASSGSADLLREIINDLCVNVSKGKLAVVNQDGVVSRKGTQHMIAQIEEWKARYEAQNAETHPPA